MRDCLLLLRRLSERIHRPCENPRRNASAATFHASQYHSNLLSKVHTHLSERRPRSPEKNDRRQKSSNGGSVRVSPSIGQVHRSSASAAPPPTSLCLRCTASGRGRWLSVSSSLVRRGQRWLECTRSQLCASGRSPAGSYRRIGGRLRVVVIFRFALTGFVLLVLHLAGHHTRRHRLRLVASLRHRHQPPPQPAVSSTRFHSGRDPAGDLVPV